MSNILIRFEQFKYKLLDSTTAGKYRYYFLTELGKNYIAKCRDDEIDYEDENVIQHETARLMQEAKEYLETFQNMHEDNWEILLDDALIMRLKYYGDFQGESELLVDNFLETIEKVLLSNDECYIDKILKLLSGNVILQGRLASFMDKFGPFSFILGALDDGENILQIYEFLEAVIEKDEVRAKVCSEKLGWIDEFDKIQAALYEIVDQVKNKNIQDIYKSFCRYLAGNRTLSAFLTRVMKKSFDTKTL